MWDPINTPSFSEQEMACKCGQCDGLALMDAQFMAKLQWIRDKIGSPMIVTSGYRCAFHPEEVRKEQPGSHHHGLAADIKTVTSAARWQFVRFGIEAGMTGIGIAKTFTHLDCGHPSAPRPAIWPYK